MEIIKRAAKRLTSLLVVMAMVFSMMPNLASHVHAATALNLPGIEGLTASYDGGTWSYENGVISGSVTGSKNSCNQGQAVTQTLTLTNNSNANANLKFTWTVSSGKGTVEVKYNNTAVTGGSFDVDLANGDTVTISVISEAKNGAVTTATVSGIVFAVEEVSYTVTFKAPENGSYTVKPSNAAAHTITADESLTNLYNVTYELVATPAEGYVFFGWVDENKNFIAYGSTYTFSTEKDATIAPLFVSASKSAVFSVGARVFNDLQAANDYAVDNGIDKIVLMNDGILPAGNYTISAGVTLLIPRNAAGTVDREAPSCVASYADPTFYRTLYMASGANLTINGTLSVAGEHFGGQGYNGMPSGPLGYIMMQPDSTITMNEGATLFVWGYISGAGSVTAKSGSKVYENFQLRDFRGGRATVGFITGGMLNNPQRVLPMSQYYLQNVEVALTYESGAKCFAYMTATLSGGAEAPATVPIIGDASNAMFLLSSGNLTKDFEEATGRTIFKLNGILSVSPMTINLSSYKVESQNYFMPIPGHITIDVLGGSTVTLNQDVAFLPGSELYIRPDARCMLDAGKSIVVYDVDDWGGYCGHLNHRNSDLPFAPGMVSGATANREKDALVQIDGYVDASKGYVYTTSGGANIFGTGHVVTTPGTATVTYQATQADTTVSYVGIPIIPAVLQNPGKAPTETAGSDSNANFYWNSVCGMWTKGPAEGFVPGHVDTAGDGDHVCDFCGAAAGACTDAKEDGDHLCEECGQDAGTCVDTDKNHQCDTESNCTYWNTGDKACHDGEDNDHKCDWCNATIEECHDSDDGNHDCDECMQPATQCQDENKDHICDTDSKCGEYNIGSYGHTAGADGHRCDYCGKAASTCVDGDYDHVCDLGCGNTQVNWELHADASGDGDHLCDYGCGQTASVCTDEDVKDHKCDECQAVLSECADSDDKDHNCDHCGAKIEDCADVNPSDHFCDECGAPMGTVCADNNADHLCDICSKKLSECADANKDHNCDLCGAALSACADPENDGDHKCDWCGTVLSACADSESDGNHKCDECGAENVTACGDSDKNHICDTDSACTVYNSGDNAHKDGADADHVCDYCQGSVGEECYDDNHDHVCDECGETGVNAALCVDENHDHVCDYGAGYEDGCKFVHGECVDDDKDHYCDYGAQVEAEDRCVAFYGECKDSSTDDDHVCDYGCGKVLEACKDCDWTYVDNQNGTHDASCSICNEQMVDDEKHGYNETGACVCGNTAQAKIGEVYYCFFVDAVANAQDGETVILCKDVTLSQKLTVETEQVWALGENTLKTANGDENYSLVVKGHLTVNSGKIVVTGWYGIGILGQMTINGGEVAYEGYNDYLIGNWGTLVVNGGTFNGQYCCVNNFAGTTTINGGTFITEETDDSGEYESETLLANNGLSVFGGSFSTDVTAFCDAKHHTVKGESGYYEYGAHTDCAWNYTDNGDGSHDADCSGCGLQMIDNEKHGYNETGACVCGNTADVKIGETYYYSFADALKAVEDGQTITLLEEITVTEVVVIEGKSVTIEGHTINSSVTDLFTVGKGGVLTLGEGLVVNNTSSILWVKDGGKVTVAGAKLYSKNTDYTAAYVEGAGSELTVTGGEIVSEKTSALCAEMGAVITVSGGVVKTQNALFATAFSKSGGKIVLTGGEMRNGTGAAGESYTLVAAYNGIVEMTGGYVSNGVLAHESANAKATISGGVIDGYVGTNNGATLIVTGGEFAKDATKYCAYEYHTVDVDADGYYEYGTHVYVEGYCACGHIQDLHISLVIKADEMDPYEQFVNDVKYGNYGEALEIVLDFSKIDLTCITLGDASLTIGGKEDVPYMFEDGKFIIASELITGDIAIVVQAVQRHEVGDVVMENYQAADFEHNESYDLVAYCAKCGLVIKTTHYEFEGTQLHAVAQIGNTKYESLEEAIAAANVGDTIVLLEKVVVEGAKVWDLTGITVKIADVGYDYGLIVRDELTINGGNFVMEGFYGIGVAATGKLTVNGGNFSVAGDNDYLIGSYGTVVINGGTFVGQYNCVNGFAGTVTVNGGDFTVAETDCTGDYESEPVQGYATVYGGVFNNAYVADYLAEGYCVAVKNDKFVVGQHIAGDAVVENVVDATCTEKGSYDSVTYCAHCGEEMSRKAVSVEMLEHTANETVVENRKDATCTQKGSYDNVTYCACGEELNRETVEIPATGHVAGEAVIENVNNATCTAGGSYDVATYCVTCNEKLSSKTIETDALGHNWVPHATEPATCTTAGWEQHICNVCNTLSEKTTIPATGHIAGEAVIENVNDATCTAGGSYDVATYCTTCKEKLSSKTIETDALGHNWVPHTAEPATCTAAGWEQHICSVCNTLSEKATIPATGHTMGKVVTENKVEPTCTEDGSYDMVVYCATCSCEISRTTVSVAATGHQYVKTVVAPTCTQMGYTTYTCACGYSYDAEYVPVISHSYEMEVTLAPTCTQKGVRTYTCSSCGHTKTEEIAATGHAWDTGAVTKPTCTEGGYTTYTCTTCGSSYETNYTAATGHTWDEGAVDYAPTCTGDGRLVYTCACGAKRHEKIDAIGHDYRATVTDPTCTTDGYTTHTCANCGDSYVDSRVDALGHSWGDDVVTKPTCTAEGYTTHTCTVCSYSYVDSRVPATGHNYNDVVTDPTCTTDGYTSHTCVVCGHAYTDGVVPATGHNYDEKVTLAPGCTTRGEKTHTCINCGDEYVEPIAATGHKYEANVIPPTCTIPGYTSYVCSVCGDAYDGDDVPATGHTYKAVVTAPTCTEEGYTTYTCSVCNYSYVADLVAPTGHAIGQIVTENYKAPTCTEDGSYDMVIYCATCDEAFSRTAWTIEATGHQYVVTKTAPTCTEKGYTTYTCACGDSYIADYVDALGHVYDTKVTEPTCTEKGYTTYTCHCGDSYIADYVDALGHVYETEVTKPTCTEKGYTTYTCHCGDSYIADYVDALGHTAGEPVKEYGEDGTYYDEVVYCAECGEELSRVRVDLYVLGDVNGDGEIDVLDAMLVAQHIVGDVSDDAIVLAAADVNGDGEIDVLDAMMIAQYIVGDVTSFPAEEEKKS